jgi:hypothetical protein
VLQAFPNDEIKLRVPIGPIPDKMIDENGLQKAARLVRPSRPVADAIVVTPDSLVMIEGKITRVREGIGALLTYAPLIPYTPELQQYRSRPLILRLLTANPPQWAIMAAEHTNVQIKVYLPSWLEDYYNHLQSYWTSDVRAAREQRKQVLTSLGYGTPAGTDTKGG